MHVQYVIWKCTYMGQNRCEIILHPCVHYIWSDFRNTLYIFIYDGKAKRFIYICVAAATLRDLFIVVYINCTTSQHTLGLYILMCAVQGGGGDGGRFGL